MKKGQTINDFSILTKEFKNKKYYFTKLPDNYCSISFSNELYLQLSNLLDEEQRKTFAESLRMVFSEDSPLYKEFGEEECFKTSFLLLY